MLFFLCSRFIIPAALERGGSVGAFWVRRAMRLFPPYWGSVVLYVALGLLLQRGESVDALLANPVSVTLANLTMLQLLFDQPHLNYGYWSLLFELLFYVLAAGLFAAKLLRRTTLLAVAICALAILVEVVLPFGFGTRKPVLGLVSFLATMFLGTLCYRLHTRELTLRQFIPLLVLGLAMLASTALSNPASEYGVGGFLDYVTARVLALGVFLFAFALRARRIPRLLLFLGEISYSVYLLHMLVVLTISTGSAALDLVAWTAGVLVLATVSYLTVERPAIRLGQWLTRPAAGASIP